MTSPSPRRTALHAGLVLLALLGLWWSTRSPGRPGRPAAALQEAGSVPAEPPVPVPLADAFPAERSAVPPEPAASDAARFGPELAPGTGLEVRVHEPGNGRGVPGARIFFADELLLGSAGTDSPEDTRRYGLEYRSDAHGLARVPAPRGGFRIVALADGTHGSASQLEAGETRVEIELRPDPVLGVRILQDSGSPAAELTVALLSHDVGGAGRVHELGTTDEDGRVELHPARFERPGLLVRPLIEDPTALEVPVAGAAGGELVVNLPACARLEVQLLDDGGVPEPRRLPARLEFVEADAGPGLTGAERAGPTLIGGRASFPFVRAEQPFLVRVGARASETLVLRAGETRQLLLREPVAGGRVEVRLLDPEGRGLPDALVRLVRLPSDPGPTDLRVQGALVRSDAAGRLGWDYADAGARRAVRVRLATADRFQPALWAELAPRPAPGLLDLGDLRLRPAPLLVGGRVVDADGRPVSGARMTCGLLPGGASGGPIWRPDLTALSAADGRFTIHAPPFQGDVLLAVAVGTADLRVELEAR